MFNIESIPAEAQAAIPGHVAEWIKRATSPEYDQADIAIAAAQAYEQAGIPVPEIVHICRSPLEALKVIDLIERDQEITPENIAGVERPSWRSPTTGIGWCAWRALSDFCSKFLHIKEAEEAAPFIAMDKAGCFWSWFYHECFIACVMPQMKFDRGKPDGTEAYRLHCEDGPALLWPDGYALYFWRGINVAKAWIRDREKVSVVETWKALRNQELRRCFCEIFGWERIAQELGAKEIQRDDWGTLLEVDLGDDEGKPAHFVRYTCPSTGRVYVDRVPPETKTAVDGLAWKDSLTRAQYIGAAKA